MKREIASKAIGVILVVICVFVAIRGIVRQNILKEDNKFGQGKIVNFISGGRGNAGGIWIDFVLVVDGRKFKGSSRMNDYNISDADFRSNILGKNFPVLYNPNNPGNSSILITPKDFSRFGCVFPDSLNWVMKYFSEK